jgi:DNA-binding winged helix-turn-helix (wHTH) protein
MKYSVGDLTIDTGTQVVSRAGDAIALPKLSYDLLLVLVRAAPNLVSLDELMRLVWPGIVVSPETVSQRIKLLRDDCVSRGASMRATASLTALFTQASPSFLPQVAALSQTVPAA